MNNLAKKYKSKTFGGFLENRFDLLGFLEPDIIDQQEPCMVHLGIDINNLEPGTEIKVPCDVTVVDVMCSTAQVNGWGGRIIMKMQKPWNGCDYLLYGHLSHHDLPSVGDCFKKDQKIAFLGDSYENGGWYPHLHVQCITSQFFEEYQNNLHEIDGYHFKKEQNWSKLVGNPTDLMLN